MKNLLGLAKSLAASVSYTNKKLRASEEEILSKVANRLDESEVAIKESIQDAIVELLLEASKELASQHALALSEAAEGDSESVPFNPDPAELLTGIQQLQENIYERIKVLAGNDQRIQQFADSQLAAIKASLQFLNDKQRATDLALGDALAKTEVASQSLAKVNSVLQDLSYFSGTIKQWMVKQIEEIRLNTKHELDQIKSTKADTNELVLAKQSILDYVDKLYQTIPKPVQGPMGPAGRDGQDGKEWFFQFSDTRPGILMYKRSDERNWKYFDFLNQIRASVAAAVGNIPMQVGGGGGGGPGGGDGAGIIFCEEGVRISEASVVNFVGAGITVTEPTLGQAEVTFTGVDTAENISTPGVFKEKLGQTLYFKSLVAGTNVNIVEQDNALIFTADTAVVEGAIDQPSNYFGPTGRIERVGVYVEKKNITGASSGKLTFYATHNGTSSGVQLFDNILNVDTTAFLVTDDGEEYKTTLSAGYDIIDNKTITVRVVEGNAVTQLIGLLRRSLKPATNTSVVVHVKVTGVVDEPFYDSLQVVPPTTTPTANGVPRADSNGQIADGWLSGNVFKTQYTPGVAATPTTIYSFLANTYRSAKFYVQAARSTNYQSTEILLVHDGSTVNIQQSTPLFTNSEEVTYTATIVGGEVRLVAVSSALTYDIRVMALLIPV